MRVLQPGPSAGAFAGTGTATHDLTLPAGVSAVAVLGVIAATVRLQLLDGATSLYDETITLDGRQALTFEGLPDDQAATARVTLAGTGAISAQLLLSGVFAGLGDMQGDPTVSIVDFSRRDTDDFGTTTIVERAWAKRAALSLSVDADDVDQVTARFEDLRATACLWVADDRFDSLMVYGFWKDFSLALKQATANLYSVTIEGLPNADTTVSEGGDPAPEGADEQPLRVILPATIDDAVLNASTIAEAEYPAWTGVGNYAATNRVVRAHRIFEALVANSGVDPTTDATKWLDVGPTNRWAMFDNALGTATSGTGGFAVTLIAPITITALAVLDTDAATIRVQAGAYDQTRAPDRAGAAFLDLAVASGETITVTIAAGVSGTSVSAGTLIIGLLESMGAIEDEPSIGITDYSRKDTDDFGEVTVVERAWAKRMQPRTAIDSGAVDMVLRRAAAIRAKPVLWLGADGVNAATIYGFYKDFSVQIGPSVSICSLTLEGMSRAAPTPPPLTIPWPNVTSPDPTRPKPDDGAVNTRNPTSPLGPDGETVGGALARILAAEAGIDDLIAVYGSTESAEAAKLAAEAARDVAIAARNVATGARDDAQAALDLTTGARDIAIGAKDAAGVARDQAVDAKNLAQSAAGAAGGSAEAASGSADTATTKATEAGQSAEAAHADAVTANTKAGESAGYAQSSSEHADAALASQNEATSQAQAAHTDRVAAESARDQSAGSAQAALESEQLAETHSTAAGDSAQAADLAKTTAITKAEESAQHAQASSEHADAALASQSAAQTSAEAAHTDRVAAEAARDLADGHAQAASDASDTATAKATEAGQQASAAHDERVAAETAKGVAETKAGQAATSQENAHGSEVAAAGYRDETITARNAAGDYVTAASGFASVAEGHATDSGTAATSAQGFRNAAEGFSQDAHTEADVATGQAAVATEKAAAAQTSATLAASVGGATLNANPAFSGYPTTSGLPTNWNDWVSGGSGTRVAGEAGGYGYHAAVAADTNQGLVQSFYLTAGDYVLDLGGWVEAGDWRGIALFVQRADNGDDLGHIFCGVDQSTDNGIGAGGPGIRHFSKFVHIAYTGTINLYAMTAWEGGGQARPAKTFNWFKAALRRASAPESLAKTANDALAGKASIDQLNEVAADAESARAATQSTLEASIGGVNATVEEQAVAIATLDGRTGVVWQVVETLPGGTARLALTNTAGGGSDFIVDSDNALFSGNVITGVVKSSDGKAKFDLDNARIVFNTGTVMKVTGIGFGSANQFLEWFGPTQTSFSNCTEANAVQYLKTDGSAYFGGSLSAGVFKNAVKTSSIADDVGVTTGSFGSNGGSRVVTVSFGSNANQPRYDACPASPGDPTVTIYLYRGTDSSGTLLTTQTITGNWGCSDGFGTFEPGDTRENIGGSFSYTDNSGGTSSSYYARAVITRTLTPYEQGLGIVSVEE